MSAVRTSQSGRAIKSAAEPSNHYFGFGMDSEEDDDNQDVFPQLYDCAPPQAPGQDAATRLRRSTARQRQYSEVLSSGDDGDDFDEQIDLDKLSPNALRQAKRRIGNRECARRIRQRKLDLMTQLTDQLERLQATNGELMAVLAAVTRQWRGVSAQNCELKANLALAHALRHGKGGLLDHEAGAALQLQRMVI